MTDQRGAAKNSELVYVKPQQIKGTHLIFRNACLEDAAFIVALRTDSKKSQYISATSADVQQQIAWLERYAKDDSQIYFIIHDPHMERLGTVRLYDRQKDSFCWGSWILKEGTPNMYSIESALIVYHYALSLGFKSAHFEVRKGNASVLRFHERFGAKMVRETPEDFFYKISDQAIAQSLKRYAKFLSSGITVS